MQEPVVHVHVTNIFAAEAEDRMLPMQQVDMMEQYEEPEDMVMGETAQEQQQNNWMYRG